MSDVQRACPICMDLFIDPKLLGCAHSFCLPCIERCKDEKSSERTIVCPICRDVTCLKRSGLDGLLTNYFVPDKRDTKAKSCYQCDSIDRVRRCMVCEENVCLRCRSMHKCTWFVEYTKENDDSIQTEEGPVPALVPDMAKTKYKAILLTEFSVEFPEKKEKQNLWINAVIPVNETEAWVIAGNGPYIIRYDMLGKEKERHHVGNDIIDAVLSPDGTLFILCLQYNAIFCLRKGKLEKFIDFTDKVSGNKLAIFPNGHVVLAISLLQTSSDSKDRCEDQKSLTDQNLKQEGIVVVLDVNGRIIHKYSKNKPFCPFSISCNWNMNSICICDTANNIVDILLYDGTLLGSYGGPIRSPLDFMFMLQRQSLGQQTFRPLGSTTDADGRFFISDEKSRGIHVLSPTGDLEGHLITDAPDGFGFPTNIEMDVEGKLWVGNGKAGTVKVFRISQYINELEKFGIE